jgi:hypothetical protein
MHLTERINCMEEAFNTLNGLLIRMLNSCEFLFICRLKTLAYTTTSRIFSFVYYNKISLETILISTLNNSFDCDLNKRSTRFLANGRG